jgi:hypothetical protein
MAEIDEVIDLAACLDFCVAAARRQIVLQAPQVLGLFPVDDLQGNAQAAGSRAGAGCR